MTSATRRPTPAADSRAANLEALARLGHDYLAIESRPSTAGFVTWLGETARSDQPDRQGDAVELATFHAAKGLEWPVVHLAGLEQGLVPIGHARTDDDLAEERRLFYVAITRAEQELRLHLGPEPHLRRAHRGPHRLALPRRRSSWPPRRCATAPCRPTGPPTWPPSGRACASSPPGPAGRATRRGGPAARPAAPELDAAGQATFEALKAWRSRQAKAAVGARLRDLPRPGAGSRWPRPGPRSRGRPAGRAGHRRGQGATLRRRDPGHPGRARGILNPMRFATEQRFAADLADRAGAVHRPRPLPHPRRACPRSARPRWSTTGRRAPACASGSTSASPATCPRAALAVIDPTKLTWIEQLDFDLDRATATHAGCVPDHYADRLTCSGRYTYLADGDRAHPARLDGELKVRMPLVGGKVEGALVSGLREHAAAEQALIAARLAELTPGRRARATAQRARRSRSACSRWALSSANRPKSMLMNRPSASAHSRSAPSASVA